MEPHKFSMYYVDRIVCHVSLSMFPFCSRLAVNFVVVHFWQFKFKRVSFLYCIIIQAARETGALQAAKNKLEKQVEELTWRLQLEKRMRVSIIMNLIELVSEYWVCSFWVSKTTLGIVFLLHCVSHSNMMSTGKWTVDTSKKKKKI